VPLDSSAARMPLPLATIAAAVFDSNALSIQSLDGLGNWRDLRARILTRRR
jgi:hypothetical protein